MIQLGQGVEIILDNTLSVVYGTSASTPMFAGILALINDELLNKNLPTLGINSGSILPSFAKFCLCDVVV